MLPTPAPPTKPKQPVTRSQRKAITRIPPPRPKNKWGTMKVARLDPDTGTVTCETVTASSGRLWHTHEIGRRGQTTHIYNTRQETAA